MRKIPASAVNLFQLIYVLIREYREKTGQAPMNLSLGNPDGVPPEAVLELQARFARDPSFALHTYAEDTNLEQFVEGMVQIHGRIDYAAFAHLSALPIPGIKTASALLPLSCGLHRSPAEREAFTTVSHLPAYDIIGTWGQGYLGGKRIAWPLSPAEGMRLSVPTLKAVLLQHNNPKVDLIFTIRPGNPASVGATEAEWKELIAFCITHKIRLANDAAYTALSQSTAHVPLAAVACQYPELEWVELYSVSKSFNDPGARLGAIVGSKDWIEDFRLIKGNTDSGPVPSVMAAYGSFFKQKKSTEEALVQLRTLYTKRLQFIIPELRAAGMQQACQTEAGFFTLWKVPRSAFGIDLATYAAEKGQSVSEAYNRLVIERLGLVGVHFQSGAAPASNNSGANGLLLASEPLIRYAVCTDVLDPVFQERFRLALKSIQPIY